MLLSAFLEKDQCLEATCTSKKQISAGFFFNKRLLLTIINDKWHLVKSKQMVPERAEVLHSF